MNIRGLTLGLAVGVMTAGGVAPAEQTVTAPAGPNTVPGETITLIPAIIELSPVSVEPDRTNWAISTAESAAATAAAILGGGIRAADGVATLVTSQRDATPFLWECVVGRAHWLVRFESVSMAIPTGPTTATEQVLTLRVLLEPRRGSLVWIIAAVGTYDNEFWPIPPGDVASERIAAGGEEKFHAFIDTRPRHTLAEALGEVARSGLGGVASARELFAYYVTWSMMRYEAQPAWSIEVRGLPGWPVNADRGGPIGNRRPPWAPKREPVQTPDAIEPSLPERAPQPQLNINARNHLRHIILDGPGTWITAGTSPQPNPPKGTRAWDEYQLAEQKAQSEFRERARRWHEKQGLPIPPEYIEPE